MLSSNSEPNMPRGCRVLCLDGGGYLGLATAAFLRELESHYGKPCHEAFDLFVGTSTGGIIALALASGMSADEVVNLYKEIGKSVFVRRRFPVRLFMWLPRMFFPQYSAKPLEAALKQAFGDKTFRDVTALGKACAIPAFNIMRGSPRIFKTNHAENLTTDGELKLVDIARATSAAPTYFSAAKVVNPTTGITEVLSDGGLFANNPALIGLVEALSYLKTRPDRVQLLSISTPRSELGLGHRKLTKGGGLIGWARVLLDVFVNTPSLLTHSAVHELSVSLKVDYERVELKQPAKKLAIDSADENATQELLSIGVSEGRSNVVRDRVKKFFGRK